MSEYIMRPEDLPIQVTLEWPAGVIQRGSATQPNIQEFAKDGKRYVTATVELDPPFDHLAHAKAALDRLDKESAMSEYTEEDFKNAMFAVLPKYGLRAHRSAGNSYWQRDGINRATNAEMAAAGWRPVREAAPLTLDTLREAWETAESLDACRSILSEGDVLIIKEPHDIYLVRPAYEGVFVGRADAENARVLHRAPKREPWKALGDKLAVEMPGIEDEPRIEALAKALYCEHGVRVVGGDEA